MPGLLRACDLTAIDLVNALRWLEFDPPVIFRSERRPPIDLRRESEYDEIEPGTLLGAALCNLLDEDALQEAHDILIDEPPEKMPVDFFLLRMGCPAPSPQELRWLVEYQREADRGGSARSCVHFADLAAGGVVGDIVPQPVMDIDFWGRDMIGGTWKESIETRERILREMCEQRGASS